MLRTALPLLAALALLAACKGDDTGPGGGGTGTGGAGGATTGAGGSGASTGGGTTTSPTTSTDTTSTTSTSSTSTTTTSSPCPPGVTCVDTFPFTDTRDTSVEGDSVLDGYSCAPNTDESGPEILYRVTVPEAGFLSAAVYDDAGVDIDVHILSARDAAACRSRGDHHARADVPAGEHWIVADTYVSGGVALTGAFRIDIGFLVPSKGPCDMESGEMIRQNDGGNHLAMPATGPIVKEAHLVTQDEPPPYPTSFTDQLADHYALSQATTGLVMYRDQQWAPMEGGGAFYGAGIGDPASFPTLHEGWYVNMYWTSAARPAKGTRMIFREPGGNRAVVVAAGYETGPGDLSHVGGTPEETHFYMGTGHLDTMTLGIAADQTLPYGPRECQ